MGIPSSTKYIINSDGTLAERQAFVTSGGALDAQQIPALNDLGLLDQSLFPSDVSAPSAVIVAQEALSAGDFVNIFNNGGAKVRKADASVSGKHAMGFVKANYDAGDNATIYFAGANTFVTGQIPGDVFLSTTPGKATSTPSPGSGLIVQNIGFATSATSINFKASSPITMA